MYLNSRSEVSDIISFIERTEKEYYFSQILENNSEIFALLEFDCLPRDLKKLLSPRIYEKHVIQYSFGRRDYRKGLYMKIEVIEMIFLIMKLNLL